jgi:hypothetical protein
MGYLYNFLKPTDEYYANWQELRRRRKRFWQYTALTIPGIAVLWGIATLLCWLFRSKIALAPAGVLTLAALVAWMIWSFMERWHLLRWPCPRCRRPFFNYRWVGYSSLTCRCLHCGLDIYAPCDPAHQQWRYESHVSPSSSQPAE